MLMFGGVELAVRVARSSTVSESRIPFCTASATVIVSPVARTVRVLDVQSMFTSLGLRARRVLEVDTVLCSETSVDVDTVSALLEDTCEERAGFPVTRGGWTVEEEEEAAC